MNILPKKRWHVRTKDNVARVRRDQAKAKEEEDSRQERAALAEQEARTSLLRQRAAVQREKDGGGGNFLEQAATTASSTSGGDRGGIDDEPGGHVNFFKDLEEQERTFGKNKEYEQEKRLEKEAEERKIGLLKYLGEGSTEYMKETPWYQRAPASRASAVAATTTKSKPPSSTATATIAATPTSSTLKTESTAASSKLEACASSESKTRRKRASKKDKKKSKKKKRRRSRRSTSSRSGSSSEEDDDEETDGAGRRHSRDLKQSTSEAATGCRVDIEKLRNDRIRREREERLKAEALLRRMRGGEEEPKKPIQYEQRYSSQFNPDLARQNR